MSSKHESHASASGLQGAGTKGAPSPPEPLQGTAVKRQRRGPARMGGPRRGSLDALVQQADLPLGPNSFAALMEYHIDIMKTLFMCDDRANMRLHRFLKLIRKGAISSTLFSGWSCWTHMLEMGKEALRELGVTIDDSLWTFYSACDFEKLPQRVISNLPERLRPQHLHVDVLDRLPLDFMDKVRKKAPPPEAAVEAHLEHYNKFGKVLMRNPKKLFPENLHARCLFHPGKLCPVYPERQKFQKAIISLDSDDDDKEEGPLLLTAASNSCKPFSALGKTKGFSDEGVAALHCWMAERNARREDVAFQENTPLFDDHYVVDGSADYGRVITIRSGPEKEGWPVSRWRTQNAIINEARFVWVGPADQAGVEAEYAALFHRSCQLTSNVFIQDSPVNLRTDIIDFAKHRKLYLNESLPDEVLLQQWPAILNSSQKRHLASYNAELSSRAALSGHYCGDLEQDPLSHCGGGPLLPGLPTHFTIWDFQEKRVYSKREMMTSMGFPALPHVCRSPYSAVVDKIADSLSSKEAQHLIGNGQHLHTYMTFVFYVLSNLVHREQYKPWSFVEGSPAGESEDD